MNNFKDLLDKTLKVYMEESAKGNYLTPSQVINSLINKEEISLMAGTLVKEYFRRKESMFEGIPSDDMTRTLEVYKSILSEAEEKEKEVIEEKREAEEKGERVSYGMNDVDVPIYSYEEFNRKWRLIATDIHVKVQMAEAVNAPAEMVTPLKASCAMISQILEDLEPLDLQEKSQTTFGKKFSSLFK